MSFEPRVVAGGCPDGGDGRRPETSDAELVELVLAGLDLQGRAAVPGRDAFSALVRRHEGRVLRVLRHLIGNEEDARDVAQDAFFRAYRSLATYRPAGSFRSWLLRIAVNAARDDWHRRGAGRLRAVARVPETQAPGRPGAAAEDAILAAQLRRLAERLAPREREVFVLRDLEGLGVDEVARALDLAEPTVRRHLARARLALRQLLGGVGGETPR
jgi:RNA polymerase sigma-70 factor (ECF subfamily)